MTSLPGNGSIRVVIPFKDLAGAKSRLAGIVPAVRSRLAQLMLMHTVSRWNQIDRAQVVVVSGAPGTGALLRAHGLRTDILPDPGMGLNAAFDRGAEDPAPGELVIATMADLPAVTAGDLSSAMELLGSGTGRWFVADTAGTGSTLLAARDQTLSPLFGADSANRHRHSGAVELSVGAGLRSDVDTPADLMALADAGSLPEPIATLLDAAGTPRIHHCATVHTGGREGVRLILSDGSQVPVAAPALAPEVSHWQPGQRVQTVLDDQGVVRAVWL